MHTQKIVAAGALALAGAVAVPTAAAADPPTGNFGTCVQARAHLGIPLGVELAPPHTGTGPGVSWVEIIVNPDGTISFESRFVGPISVEMFDFLIACGPIPGG